MIIAIITTVKIHLNKSDNLSLKLQNYEKEKRHKVAKQPKKQSILQLIWPHTLSWWHKSKAPKWNKHSKYIPHWGMNRLYKLKSQGRHPERRAWTEYGVLGLVNFHLSWTFKSRMSIRGRTKSSLSKLLNREYVECKKDQKDTNGHSDINRIPHRLHESSSLTACTIIKDTGGQIQLISQFQSWASAYTPQLPGETNLELNLGSWIL